VLGAAQSATAGQGQLAALMLGQADQARDLARDCDGQAVHTRVVKHSAHPARDAEGAHRGPSEAHEEDSVFGGMQPLGAQDALNCQEVGPPVWIARGKSSTAEGMQQIGSHWQGF
jgi:hypothetical protein